MSDRWPARREARRSTRSSGTPSPPNSPFPLASAGLQGSGGPPALGKRKERDEEGEAPPPEAARADGGSPAAPAAVRDEPEERGAKRLATAAGPAPARPLQPAKASEAAKQQRQQVAGALGKQVAGGGSGKRKEAELDAAAGTSAATGNDASPPLPRAAVRPRWEQPASSSGGAAAVGSPAPSPYRVLSPAKAGAASLSALPGFQFSKSRRSSTASDAASTAGSRGGAIGASGSAGGGLQPPYRRKLAAPPSRLGGAPFALESQYRMCCCCCVSPLLAVGSMPTATPFCRPHRRHAWLSRHARPPAARRARRAGRRPVRV